MLQQVAEEDNKDEENIDDRENEWEERRAADEMKWKITKSTLHWSDTEAQRAATWMKDIGHSGHSERFAFGGCSVYFYWYWWYNTARMKDMISCSGQLGH